MGTTIGAFLEHGGRQPARLDDYLSNGAASRRRRCDLMNGENNAEKQASKRH